MANKNVVLTDGGGSGRKFTFSGTPASTTGTTTASGTKTSAGTKSPPTVNIPGIPPYRPVVNTTKPTTTEPEMTEEEKAAAEAEKKAAEAEKKAAEEAAAAAELESRTFGIPTNRDPGRPDYTYTDVPMPARGEQQSWQGMDMYSALLALQNQYNQNMAGARPKTEAEIQQQAGADYASYYDQLRRAAANQYALQDLSYLQQRQGIQNSYDKNREASARNYAQNYSQADRQLLSRGMQRSSYGAQTLANIARQGAEAQQAIWDQQIQSEANVDAMRQQLLANYANTQQGYDAGQASDVLSRIWGLRDTEYDRQVTRANTLNQLATQLYGYLNGINEVGREQFNTEANLRENQHQFDTNVAESRQGVLDTRVNNQMANDMNWAQFLEQMYQYSNDANWKELQYRYENPANTFTRAGDGRYVLPNAPGANTVRTAFYSGYPGPNIVVRPNVTGTTSSTTATSAASGKTTGSGTTSSSQNNLAGSVINNIANKYPAYIPKSTQ